MHLILDTGPRPFIQRCMLPNIVSQEKMECTHALMLQVSIQMMLELDLSVI